MGACAHPSKTTNSELRIFFFIPSAKRVEVTWSCRPKVICVGAVILPSCASASCAITALDYSRNAATDCAGRLRTKPASDGIYSGFAAYSSGVKHHGKIARITISGTLASALAVTCQLATTVFIKGSVFGQPLCSPSDLTFAGCLAASHMPIAAPSDKPEICAFCNPSACMNAATSSARFSVEYEPSGLSVSPVPRKSTEIHGNCLPYSSPLNAYQPYPAVKSATRMTVPPF